MSYNLALVSNIRRREKHATVLFAGSLFPVPAMLLEWPCSLCVAA